MPAWRSIATPSATSSCGALSMPPACACPTARPSWWCRPSAPQPEVDLLVESVELATERVVAAGGALLAGPSEIPVGRVVAVADPFGNSLVLLELSKGHYRT